MFNTLKYAKMMEEVGFSREQAETSVKILVDVMEERLATKQDLADLNHGLEVRFAELNAEFNARFHKVDSGFLELKKDMVLLESRMTVKLGSLIVAAIAAVSAIHRFI